MYKIYAHKGVTCHASIFLHEMCARVKILLRVVLGCDCCYGDSERVEFSASGIISD